MLPHVLCQMTERPLCGAAAGAMEGLGGSWGEAAGGRLCSEGTSSERTTGVEGEVGSRLETDRARMLTS